MKSTLLTRLPRAPRLLAPLSGTNALAVVDDDRNCFIVPPIGPLPSPPPAVHRLDARAAGAGGWGNHAHFVDGAGRVAVADLGTGRVVHRDIPPCARWVAARDARRSARIISSGDIYRSDSVQVWDEERNVLLAKVAPDTRDSFQVDRVALDPGGERVALTGLDVTYTSDGDWNWGQDEVLIVRSVASGRLLLDVVVGSTSSPSEHEPIPTALAEGRCAAGGRFFTLPVDDEDLPQPGRVTLEDDALFESVSLLAMLDGDRVALVRDFARGQLLIASTDGTVHGFEETRSPVTALTRLGKGLVAGLEDGSLLLLT